MRRRIFVFGKSGPLGQSVVGASRRRAAPGSQFVGVAAAAATCLLRTQSSNTNSQSLLRASRRQVRCGAWLAPLRMPRSFERWWDSSRNSGCWLCLGRHLRFPSAGSRKAAVAELLVLASAFVRACVLQAERAITLRSRRGPTARHQARATAVVIMPPHGPGVSPPVPP